MSTPSPNGRDGSGRFTRGNAGGPGNPHAARCAKLRAAALRACSARDYLEIIKAQVDKARKGDLAAAAFVRDTILGRPAQMDVLARIEALEEILNEH